MKVLLINHFPLEGSGSGTYTKNIALHLRKRGHEVAVIFPENQPFPMLPGIQMYPVMFSSRSCPIFPKSPEMMRS